MEKKKVLIAVHQLNLGGVQKAMISALGAIDYNKYDVTLYVRKDRLDLLGEVNKKVSRIIINSDKTRYYRKPYAAFLTCVISIKRALRLDAEKTNEKLIRYLVKKQFEYETGHHPELSERYDVAVSFIQGFTAQLVAERITADKKAVFFHGSTDDHHEIHEHIFSDFDEIYCVSGPALESVKSFYPRHADKMRCFENYVDPGEVRKQADEYEPEYPKDGLVICSCGRMTEVKGFDLAVRAAKKLKDGGLDFKWYFVGDGPDRKKIEELIASFGLQSEMEITGLKENPYPYIKNCDIYVQPSYEESQGLTMIEAGILCRPVVSTDTAGAKSLITDGEDGVIANTDPASLAEKVEFLARDWKSREHITDALSKKDHTADRLRFERQWAELLGG